jgi:hypothetical protein
MKRIFAILILLSSAAFGTTTVTGNIRDLGTGAIGTTAFVRFWLRGCGGNQPFVSGTGMIGPSQGGVFYKDFSADATGAISGTLYSTRDATGLLGGDITCGTSTTAVWYGMQIFNNGKGAPETMLHAKNGVAINIGSPVPITTFPVVPPATGDTFYFRLDGGNDSIKNISNTEVDLLGKICWPDTTCQTTAAAGGSGTVTSFSAGNLSPLFTTSVTTASTTPALSFSLSNASANTVYAGPTSGGASAPIFRALVNADIPTGDQNPGTTTGDVLDCSNTATPCTLERIGIGTPGQTLTVNSAGTHAQWTSPFSIKIGPQNGAVAATTIVPAGTAGLYVVDYYGSVPTPCSSGTAHIDFMMMTTDDSGLPISDGASANADPGVFAISSFQLNNFQSTGGIYTPTQVFPNPVSIASNGTAPIQYQIYYEPCNAGAYTCSAGVIDCTTTPGVPACTAGGTASCAGGQTVACHRIYNATATITNRYAGTCDINAQSANGTYVIRLGVQRVQ